MGVLKLAWAWSKHVHGLHSFFFFRLIVLPSLFTLFVFVSRSVICASPKWKVKEKKEKSNSKNPNGWACMLSTWPSSPTSHVALTLPLPSSYSWIPSLTSLSAELETWTTPHLLVSIHFHPLSSTITSNTTIITSSSSMLSFARQHIIISSVRVKCDRRPDIEGARV